MTDLDAAEKRARQAAVSKGWARQYAGKLADDVLALVSRVRELEAVLNASESAEGWNAWIAIQAERDRYLQLLRDVDFYYGGDTHSGVAKRVRAALEARDG